MNYFCNVEIFESCDMVVCKSLLSLVKMILVKCSQTIFKIKQETNLKESKGFCPKFYHPSQLFLQTLASKTFFSYKNVYIFNLSTNHFQAKMLWYLKLNLHFNWISCGHGKNHGGLMGTFVWQKFLKEGSTRFKKMRGGVPQVDIGDET